jgi:hypothetical protein
MSIVRTLRDHISTCPILPEYYDGMGIDFLADGNTAYMIETEPSDPILKRYINGDTEQQYVFAFCSREPYSLDVVGNIENVEFYENFKDWMNECTRNGNLPDLGEGKKAQKLEALSWGYLYDEAMTSAQYRIQCRLVFYQKGN